MSKFENPPEEPTANETFLQFQSIVSPENWITQERDQHRYMARQICKIVERGQDWLAKRNGFALFEFFHDDSTYRLLWTNQGIKPRGGTGIAINHIRSSTFGEPGFPDGRTITMTDIVAKGNRLNVESSTQHRDHHTHNWQTPADTTLLIAKSGQLFGYGNFRNPKTQNTSLQSYQHTPLQPSRVIHNNQIMHDALWAILNCRGNYINEDLTHFSN